MGPSRQRRVRVDRLVGVVALTLGAVVVGATVLSLARPDATTRVDLGVLGDLSARLARAEHAEYRATYEVRRDTTDRSSIGTVTEVRLGGVELVASPETLAMSVAGRAFICTRTPDGAQCLERAPADDPIPTAALVAEAVASGRYVLGRGDSRTIAGEPAQCFRLRATGPQLLAPFGAELTLCLDDGGVTRFSRRDDGGVVDQRDAVLVDHDVDPDEIDAIFERFDPELRERAALDP